MSQTLDEIDQVLTLDGENVTLRRTIGSTNYDVTVRASVRAFAPEELVGGIQQTDSSVVISPTQIANANWPNNPTPSAQDPTPAYPKKNDKMIIQGRMRTITLVKPIVVNGELVRFDIIVAG